jgi:Sec-independent protein secretion pathway component TatC
LLLETVPLYLLFEVSVVLAAVAERRARARMTCDQAVTSSAG